MASGFDGTSFATGLLSNANNQIAMRQKMQMEGDAKQLDTFQDAAKEYDQAKAKASDDKNKIDSLANVISNGNPNAAAYATARDAVNMGYTSEEHIPYVVKAYQATLKDMQSNPDKWSVDPQQKAQLSEDSDPAQTALLRRFGNKEPIENIEDIRQHNITRAYNNLPSAQWGDPEKIIGDQTYNRAKASAQAQQDVTTDFLGQHGYGGVNSSGADVNAQPAPSAAPQQGGVPAAQPSPNATGQDMTQPNNGLAVNASALSPNTGGPPDPGIKIDAPPPPDTGGATQATAPATAQAGQPPQGQPAPSAPPPKPVQPALPTTRDEKYLGTLPRSEQNILRMMSDGDYPLPGQYQLGRPGAQSALANARIDALRQFDPSANEGRMAAKNKMKSDPEVVQLNTTIGHLGALDQAANAMQNGDTVALNRVANFLGVQTGKDPTTTYNIIAQRVSQETDKLYHGGGSGTVAGAEEAEKNMGNFLSPQQAHGAIQAQVHMLGSKIDAMENRWQTVMGNAYTQHSFLSPVAASTLQRMQSENGDMNTGNPANANSQQPTQPVPVQTQEGLNALAKTGAPAIQIPDPNNPGGFITLRKKAQ